MVTTLSDNREVELLEKKAAPSKSKSDLSESAVVSARDESDSVTEDESNEETTSTSKASGTCPVQSPESDSATEDELDTELGETPI